PGGALGGNRFQDDREAACSFESPRVLQEVPRLLRGPALRAKAAEHRRGLRRQTDMAHHGNPGSDELYDARQRGARALELHRLGARLLDEAVTVSHRVLARDLG